MTIAMFLIIIAALLLGTGITSTILE